LIPLGLHNTYTVFEETLPDNIAHTWSDDFNPDGLLEDVTHIPRTAHDSITRTIFSTPEDVVKFSHALFQGDLLSPASLNQMLEFVPTPADFGAQGYGLGVTHFFLSFAAGEDSIGHTGGGIGHITILAHLPDQEVSLVVQVNDENGDCLYGIKDALIQVILNHIRKNQK
jgi:D-alanyl-D-alanine carboxypeptidase